MHLFKGEKRLAALAAVICFCLGMGTAHVEAARADRYFVDEENRTGYYVDVNSIELSGEHEILLDLYLLKLNGGLLYRYRTYFNTEEGSYEYRHSKIYDYETKELLSDTDQSLGKLSYQKSPMLGKVLDFALEWKRTHIHLTPYGETWE